MLAVLFIIVHPFIVEVLGVLIWSSKVVGTRGFRVLWTKLGNQNYCPDHDLLRPLKSVHFPKEAVVLRDQEKLIYVGTAILLVSFFFFLVHSLIIMGSWDKLIPQNVDTINF